MLAINEERLQRMLYELNSIGRGHPDDASNSQGLYRMALSENDLKGREYIKQQMTAAGLNVVEDGALNIHGRLNWPAELEKPSAAQPAIATGSHCDTVPGGGELDGALGVLAGIEALHRLKEEKVSLHYPLEVINFTDEEGRFGGMLGSMSLAGKLNAAQINSMISADGQRVADLLEAYGSGVDSAVSAAYPAGSLHAYVELHIEQGPVLDSNHEQLGIVTGIVGLWKAEFTFTGQANHAGTTPMSMRSDAFAGCAELRVALDALLARYGGSSNNNNSSSSSSSSSNKNNNSNNNNHNNSNNNINSNNINTGNNINSGNNSSISCTSVGTIGSVRVHPGAANIVPGSCECVLEVRDPSDAVLMRLSAAVVRTAEEIAARRKLSVKHRVMSEMKSMHCDCGLMRCIEQVAIASNGSNSDDRSSRSGDDSINRSNHSNTHHSTIYSMNNNNNWRWRRMPSGAAHDAQQIPQLGAAALIFVPSIDGISHHHSEATHWTDIVRGANILLNSLLLLATGEAAPSGTTAAVIEDVDRRNEEALAVDRDRSGAINGSNLTSISDSNGSCISSSNSSSNSSCDKTCALLCIDMQSMPPTTTRTDVDFTADQVASYQQLLQSRVLPNARKMLHYLRSCGCEVIHTRIQSLTRDGRDRSALHKRMRVHAAPDCYSSSDASLAAQWLPGVEPLDDEIVLSKTASNAFVSTNIHYVLGNLGIKKLVVMGTLTDECVGSTAKAAADLGYDVTVVADACAAGTPERHNAALLTLRRYAAVVDTKDCIGEI